MDKIAEYYYHKGVYEGLSQGRADALKILEEFVKSNAKPVIVIKSQEVDLEKVVMIDNMIMDMTAEGYNNGYKTRPFYEEVLRRLNARKKEDIPEYPLGCDNNGNLVWTVCSEKK